MTTGTGMIGRLVALGGATALVLTGCGNDGQEFCDRVQEPEWSAVVFSTYAATEDPAARAGQRIELLDGLEAPTDELEDDFKTWMTYLEELEGMELGDPEVFDIATDEVEAAREDLFDDQLHECLE